MPPSPGKVGLVHGEDDLEEVVDEPHAEAGEEDGVAPRHLVPIVVVVAPVPRGPQVAVEVWPAGARGYGRMRACQPVITPEESALRCWWARSGRRW